MAYEDEAPQGEVTQQEDEEAVGPFQRSDEALVRCIRAWWKEAADAKRTAQPKRDTDWRMLGGKQWADEDAQVYDRQKRPRLTLNMLRAIIAAVEGEERSDRKDLKFFGEGDDDDPAAYGLNLILKWVMNQCGGQFSLSKMFRHGIVVEGWIVPEVDYFEDPEGKIKLEWVDEDEIFDDPLNTCEVSGKSRYVHRAKHLSEDELEARWPGSREKLRQHLDGGEAARETDGSGYRDIYSTPNDTKSVKIYDAAKKQWCVLETWWWQIEPGWVISDPTTGLLTEASDEEFAQLKDQREQEQLAFLQARMAGTLEPIEPEQIDPVTGATMAPAVMPPAIDAVQRPIKRFYQAFTSYDVLLEKKASPLKQLKRFPYVPFRAIWDKSDKEWHGLIRDLWDPQKQYNVEQSIIVQLVQLMPKQSWMAPKGAYHNKQEWQEKIAQPGALLEYNASRGKPEPIQAPAIPRHLMEAAYSRPNLMREISGVNIEMTGVRQGSDAGVVFDQRKKAAKTVLAPVFDNYLFSKLELGKVLLAYIQTYVSVGRRIRVLGPQKAAQLVTMTTDMQLGRYDVTMDEGEVDETEATLNVLQTTLPNMVKAGMSITPAFIDLMPMRPDIRDEWKRQVAWDMTVAGRLPPPGWQPGMPVPGAPPPGMPAPPPTEEQPPA